MDSIAEAVQVLQNQKAAEEKRVKAAHFLGESKSPAAAEALVQALDEDDYGVHWAASESLAAMGEMALPALLAALVRPDCSPRVIHGAKHVFHTSVDRQVKEETKELLAAMHGSGQSFKVMQEASKLMMKLKIS